MSQKKIEPALEKKGHLKLTDKIDAEYSSTDQSDNDERRSFLKKISSVGILSLSGAWLIKKASARTEALSPERRKLNKQESEFSKNNIFPCDCDEKCATKCESCADNCSSNCFECDTCACDPTDERISKFSAQAVHQQGGVVITSKVAVHNSIASNQINSNQKSILNTPQGEGIGDSRLGGSTQIWDSDI